MGQTCCAVFQLSKKIRSPLRQADATHPIRVPWHFDNWLGEVTQPTMRFVAVKTVEQQSLLSLHRARGLLVRQRTQLINGLRGLVAEFGVYIPRGLARAICLAFAGAVILWTEGTRLMAHVRRKFVDISQSQGSQIAEEAIRRIALLYAVEKAARGAPPEERAALRQICPNIWHPAMARADRGNLRSRGGAPSRITT